MFDTSSIRAKIHSETFIEPLVEYFKICNRVCWRLLHLYPSFSGTAAGQSKPDPDRRIAFYPGSLGSRGLSVEGCELLLWKKKACSIAVAHNTPRAVVGKAISNMKTHNFHGIPTSSSSSIRIPHQIALFRRRWAKVRVFSVLEMVKGSVINMLLPRH